MKTFTILVLFVMPLLAQRTARATGDATSEPAPVIRPNPEDTLSIADRKDPAKVDVAWVTAEKRPALQADRDSRRKLRMRHCRARGAGLIIGQRAEYTDLRGVTWYVAAHPTFGVVAARDDRLLKEFGCSPRWRDGRHDRREIRAYFADQITEGTVQVRKAVPLKWTPVEVAP